MGAAQLARRVARFGKAFGRRADEDHDQILRCFIDCRPRREKIQFFATKIVKDRGIELLPGERVEDAAVHAIKANLHGNSAEPSW
jgi:hypothetical protein